MIYLNLAEKGARGRSMQLSQAGWLTMGGALFKIMVFIVFLHSASVFCALDLVWQLGFRALF